MKKALIVCSLALLSFIPASAQFSWGLRGGLNLVNNDITKVTKESASSKDSYTGFFFGPMAEVQVPIIGIGVDVAALYSQKGVELPDTSTMKNQSISIPLSLKYSLGLGNFAAVYFAAGPQFDFKIGDLNTSFKDGNEVKDFALEKSSWSINVGAGVKLINHIQAGVNYNIPVSKEGAVKVIESPTPGAVVDNEPVDFKSSTLQFSLTWTF
ncbi:MAG: porin family protein [Bacteroidaceae bacterium]|nr:porin family protein [Bacteroidaceae bacterium]